MSDRLELYLCRECGVLSELTVEEQADEFEGQRSWLYRLGCGHVTGCRIDAGELDLGLIRDEIRGDE